MSQFVTAKRDTYINLTSNMDYEAEVPKGTRMFHITSDKQTKYLDPGEIAVYHPDWNDRVFFGYEGDWE